ncbi:MAG: helix-turn-helix transcriptional regulator [Caulobacter sp.]|nr:helix-turn-helix transcriptional regulator [Caulobacter sp.]
MTGPVALNEGADSLTERGGRRRREILTAARTLVSEKGFDACRMDEVAAAVGVTKPAVYRYFPGKARLIEALLEEDLLIPSQALFADVRAFEGPLREMLDIFAQRTLAIQEGGLARGYMMLAMDEARRRPEIAALIRDQVLTPGFQLLAAAFVRAMANGELKPGEDPTMMVRLFFAPFMQITLIRGGVGVPISGHEELEAYLRLHVDAFMRAFGA